MRSTNILKIAGLPYYFNSGDVGMNTRRKLLAMAVMIFVSFYWQTSYSTEIKAVVTGEIYSSSDASNELGYGGTDLANGHRVTMYFTYDTDLAPPDWYGGARFPREADYFSYGNSATAPSWVSSVIVFDSGATFSSSDSLGTVSTTDQVKIIEKDGGSPYDYIGFHDAIYDSSRSYSIGAVAYDFYQDFVSGLSISQPIEWTLGTTSPPYVPRGTFNLSDGTAGWSFLGEVAIDAVSVQPIAVPEPATLALFGLGLAGIGFSRRKKA